MSYNVFSINTVQLLFHEIFPFVFIFNPKGLCRPSQAHLHKYSGAMHFLLSDFLRVISTTLNKLKQLNGFTESKQYSMKKYQLSVRIQSSFLVLIFPNLDRIWRFTFSPADIYFIEVNNWNNRTKCEICSNLTIKTLERHWAIRSFKRRIPQSRMIEERG